MKFRVYRPSKYDMMHFSLRDIHSNFHRSYEEGEFVCGVGGGWGFFDTFVFDYDKENDRERHIMRCTELKDKNGREIYEGDILECMEDDNKIIFQVCYGENHPDNGAASVGLYLKCQHYKTGIDIIYGVIEKDCKKMKIIGNIYENPELLERKDEV